MKRLRLPALFMVAVLISRYGAAEAGLPPEYNNWMNEDVRWIMTAQEQKDFVKLATNEERDHFVIEFWERRNPIPGLKDNLFKEEHYRRIAYSNTHFASKRPGWETDRGHVYIVYGPPDSRQVSSGTNPAGELWNYRHMPGTVGNVSFEFVDRCACGEYSLKGNLPNGN